MAVYHSLINISLNLALIRFLRPKNTITEYLTCRACTTSNVVFP